MFVAVYWGNFGRSDKNSRILLSAGKGSWALGDVMNNWRGLSPYKGVLSLPLFKAPRFVKVKGVGAEEFAFLAKGQSNPLWKGPRAESKEKKGRRDWLFPVLVRIIAFWG
ncbi:MAG TPA: hypothetical protein EYP65_06200 [Armatimonadetes bacterium]|nr:hypothetical protein [Armatimonadota bacterium]